MNNNKVTKIKTMKSASTQWNLDITHVLRLVAVFFSQQQIFLQNYIYKKKKNYDKINVKISKYIFVILLLYNRLIFFIDLK